MHAPDLLLLALLDEVGTESIFPHLRSSIERHSDAEDPAAAFLNPFLLHTEPHNVRAVLLGLEASLLVHCGPRALPPKLLRLSPLATD